MAELVSDFLKVIGISIDIEALEKGQLWESGLETQDFDLILMNNYTDVNAVAQWGYNYSCSAADLGSAQGNFASYCNQEVDQQMDTASHTASEADYQAALFSAQELLNNDRPFILLAGANKIQAYRSDRFEFPSWVCQEPENALLSYEGVMNTKPK
jgi:ABC-type transport system substrate-binding protein